MNSILITAIPRAELLRIIITPATFENARSSGHATIDSTSSDPSHGASAKTVTRGLVKFGRTSTGRDLSI